MSRWYLLSCIIRGFLEIWNRVDQVLDEPRVGILGSSSPSWLPLWQSTRKLATQQAPTRDASVAESASAQITSSTIQAPFQYPIYMRANLRVGVVLSVRPTSEASALPQGLGPDVHLSEDVVHCWRSEAFFTGCSQDRVRLATAESALRGVLIRWVDGGQALSMLKPYVCLRLRAGCHYVAVTVW